MSDLTTIEAAAYLAERGYTIGRRRAGGYGPPQAATLRRWCELEKFEGAYLEGAGNRATWKIPKAALDRLIETKPDSK